MRPSLTRALLEAVPRARAGGVRRRRGAQSIASQSTGATGCAYASRCPLADQHCRDTAPALRNVGTAHLAACHHAEARDGAARGRGGGLAFYTVLH